MKHCMIMGLPSFNGVYPALEYHLRLMKDPAEFIDHYVELLKIDETGDKNNEEIWGDCYEA